MGKAKIYDEKYYNSADYLKDLRRGLKRDMAKGTYAKNDFDKLFNIEQKEKRDDKK
jgi:hypothetical protein